MGNHKGLIRLSGRSVLNTCMGLTGLTQSLKEQTQPVTPLAVTWTPGVGWILLHECMVPMKMFSRMQSRGWVFCIPAALLQSHSCCSSWISHSPDTNLNASCWLSSGQWALMVNLTMSHMGNAKRKKPNYPASLAEWACGQFSPVWIFSFSVVKTFWTNTLQYTQKKCRSCCDLCCIRFMSFAVRVRKLSSWFRDTRHGTEQNSV